MSLRRVDGCAMQIVPMKAGNWLDAVILFTVWEFLVSLKVILDMVSDWTVTKNTNQQSPSWFVLFYLFGHWGTSI